MTTLYIILTLLGASLLGYLMGSISNGIVIGKLFFKKDPREFGSHNSGGTNVGRTFGLKIGLLCIFLDIIKTILPIWISYFVISKTSLNDIVKPEYGYLLSAVFAMLGHCFPVWHKFKGGKAVSSFGGIILATSWMLALIGVSVFLIIMLVSRKVSLGSILGSMGTALLSFVLLLCPQFFMDFGMQASLLYSITLVLCSLFLIWRHRGNVQRLIKHEERELPIGKNKKTEAK